jgi:threonine/homoserine/homoserine lactone efflux protein
VASLLAFLGVSALLIVTPGQDTALKLRNTLTGGRRAEARQALGVSSGQAIWALAAAAGLAAVRRVVDAVTGAFPVAFGARLAAERS